jgi:hypothetical protein
MSKQYRHLGPGLSGDEKYERTQSAFLKETTRARAANNEKTERLRALRLASERKARAAVAEPLTEVLPD